jgi:uncharacterized repeat protein (TIGR01451 family)
MANILGTLISDLIVPNAILQGEILPDLLGDDIIEALDGDDAVAGSSGNDSIAGGSGDDQLFGNSGQDTIEGNSGNDSIAGGRDDDRIFGGEGNDLLFGNTGEDNLRGGDGNDTIYGGKDDDILQGEDGDDVLIGDFGADTLNGGGGNDIFAIGRRPNNPDGASTGGLSADAADIFQDFRQQGDDLIRLEGGIAFADLEFADDANGDAVIRDANGTGNVLATVKGMTSAEMQAHPEWFEPTGGGGVPPAAADLSVTKTVTDGSPLTPYNPGDTIQYVVTVNNTGPDTATNVLLNDVLPAGVTFTNATGNGTYNPVTGVWNIGNVNSGGSAVLFVNATINAGATGTIVNTASGLTGAQTDPDPTDNTATVNFIVGNGVTDTVAPTAPKLVGAELLVADKAGVIGEVHATDNVGVTGFNIAQITTSGGAIVDPTAFTIDNLGNLSLSASGETILNSLGTDYLNVKVVATDAAGNASIQGTVKVFANINAAVADAEIGNATDVSDGTGQDAVLVSQGIYVSPINIGKTVTLKGANEGIDGTGTRSAESEIQGVVTVNGVNDVTLDGFKFTAGGQVNVDNAGNNLLIRNNFFDTTTLSSISDPTVGGPIKDNLRIEKNLIQNLNDDGINLSDVTNLKITNNTIQNLGVFSLWFGDGIELVDNITGAVISGNTITNMEDSGIELGNGITMTPLANVSVQGNTINGANPYQDLNDGGITLNSAADYTNLQITGNQVTGAGTGALTVGLGTVFTDANATIQGNVLDDRDGVGAVADFSIFNDENNVLTSQLNTLANGDPILLGAVPGVAPTNVGGGFANLVAVV